MVLPGAVDEHEVGRVPLVPETASPDQLQRGEVAGLDLRVQPVQPQLLERVPHHQVDPFDRYPCPAVGANAAYAIEPFWSSPADDAVDVHQPGDGPGVP